MKINNNNNCKLCEIFDNQKLSGGLNGSGGGKQTNNITQQQQQQPHYCRHSLNSETAAAISLIPPHIRDMFFAAQILRGNYPNFYFIIFFLSFGNKVFLFIIIIFKKIF